MGIDIFERVIDGHTGFLYLDAHGMPEVALHWEHRLRSVVKKYNEIYKEQMPLSHRMFAGIHTAATWQRPV